MFLGTLGAGAAEMGKYKGLIYYSIPQENPVGQYLQQQ